MRTPPSPYAIPLRDIPAEGLHRAYELTGPFAEQALAGTEVDAGQSTVSAAVDLYRTGHEVVARGKVNGQLVALCSRCASPAQLKLDSSMQIVFLPRGSEVPDVEDDEVAAEQPDVVHYDDETIDLAETLREELLLALPLAPLCREDCKGLCPRCGTDLNEGPCDCLVETKDDRWSRLKNLKLD